MSPPRISSILSMLLAFVSSIKVTNSQQIFHNAIFYTVDDTNPRASVVAVSFEGIIEAVSNNLTEVQNNYSQYTLVDLGGQFVLPGFIDTHLHLVEAGINGELCSIPADTPVRQIPAAFQNPRLCVDNGMFGGADWAMAAGIDLSILIEEIDAGNSPTPLQALDAYFGDTPVVILDAFGHGALTNTAGMKAVGYMNSRNEPAEDPPGGQLLRRGNALLGIVTENAQQKLRNAAFPNTPANQAIAYQSLLAAIPLMSRAGITSVSDAGGFWLQAQTESWETALNNSMLNVRASNALYIYPDIPIETQIRNLTARYNNNPNSQLRFNQAKIYVDGILSLSTGLISTPYLSDPFARYRGTTSGKWFGTEYFGNATNLNRVCRTLVRAGFQLHLHVTGDRAATRALDCIAASGNPSPATQPHRLTHLFVLGAADRPRFAQLGVVADFQAAPSSLAADNIELMDLRIGPALTEEFVPVAETLAQNASIVLSSDFDADVLSPLLKIQTVLTRTDPTRNLPSVAEAIRAMTINGARLLGQDATTGTIEVGKFADLAVINQDITAMPFDTIGEASVTRTYLGGRLVYAAPETTSPQPTDATTLIPSTTAIPMDTLQPSAINPQPTGVTSSPTAAQTESPVTTPQPVTPQPTEEETPDATALELEPTTQATTPSPREGGCMLCNSQKCGYDRCLFRSCVEDNGLWTCTERRNLGAGNCAGAASTHQCGGCEDNGKDNGNGETEVSYQCRSCTAKENGQECCQGCALGAAKLWDLVDNYSTAKTGLWIP